MSKKIVKRPYKMTRNIYPKVVVEDDKTWIQATRGGKWAQLSAARAEMVSDRLYRAARFMRKRGKR